MTVKEIISSTRKYNLHSHTQYCDGHAPMEEMALAAKKAGMNHLGFSPHSPIPFASPCNMQREMTQPYLDEVNRLRTLWPSGPSLYAAMEIDFISPDFGPHVDWIQRLPLDYRIGSVHFVPNQDGIPIDCDGNAQRFMRNLHDGYRDDIRYVVEKFYEQTLIMMERGGFDILGHFDKIAQNVIHADPEIESQHWYESLIDDVVTLAAANDVIVEINTKYINDKERFFPHRRWWKKLKDAKVNLAVNSDAHWPEKIAEGRTLAFSFLEEDGIILTDKK